MSNPKKQVGYWRWLIWLLLCAAILGLAWLAWRVPGHPLLLALAFVSGLLLALGLYFSSKGKAVGPAPSRVDTNDAESQNPGDQVSGPSTSVLMDSQVPYDSLPAALLTFNMQGQFLRVNAVAAQILGVPRRLLLVRSWDNYFLASDWERLCSAIEAGGGKTEIEAEFEFSDASNKEFRRLSVNATRSGDRIEVFVQDITEKAKIRDYMEFLVRHDPLTKALNRLGVERHLTNRICRMTDASALSVAYLDLDGFKGVNDLYGHQAGDELLVGVARRIVELLPAGARLGRVGGDEFLLVFSGSNLQFAAQACEHVIHSLCSAPFQLQSAEVAVSASIGVIEVAPGAGLKEVIALADHACRLAKANGKSRVVVHSRSDLSRLRREGDMKLAGHLASGEALVQLGFQLQPIVSARDPVGRLDFEVLMLLADERGDSVPADRVVSVAKSVGQMHKVDKWILSSVMNWIRENRASLMRTQHIFINLSGASLNDDRFVEGVLGVMEHFKEIAPLVCIEVTEDVALKNLYKSRQFFLKLKELGVKIALDDFGAGYTSFAYLRHLPSDFLKIDGSLIASINEDPANVSIVQGIVNMARSLGMKTVAEWAEDAACVRTLLEIGVDYVQGYAISKPMAADALLLLKSSADPIADESLRRMLTTVKSGL